MPIDFRCIFICLSVCILIIETLFNTGENMSLLCSLTNKVQRIPSYKINTSFVINS